MIINLTVIIFKFNNQLQQENQMPRQGKNQYIMYSEKDKQKGAIEEDNSFVNQKKVKLNKLNNKNNFFSMEQSRAELNQEPTQINYTLPTLFIINSLESENIIKSVFKRHQKFKEIFETVYFRTFSKAKEYLINSIHKKYCLVCDIEAAESILTDKSISKQYIEIIVYLSKKSKTKNQFMKYEQLKRKHPKFIIRQTYQLNQFAQLQLSRNSFAKQQSEQEKYGSEKKILCPQKNQLKQHSSIINNQPQKNIEQLNIKEIEIQLQKQEKSQKPSQAYDSAVRIYASSHVNNDKFFKQDSVFKNKIKEILRKFDDIVKVQEIITRQKQFLNAKDKKNYSLKIGSALYEEAQILFGDGNYLAAENLLKEAINELQPDLQFSERQALKQKSNNQQSFLTKIFSYFTTQPKTLTENQLQNTRLKTIIKCIVLQLQCYNSIVIDCGSRAQIANLGQKYINELKKQYANASIPIDIVMLQYRLEKCTIGNQKIENSIKITSSQFDEKMFQQYGSEVAREVDNGSQSKNQFKGQYFQSQSTIVKQTKLSLQKQIRLLLQKNSLDPEIARLSSFVANICQSEIKLCFSKGGEQFYQQNENQQVSKEFQHEKFNNHTFNSQLFEQTVQEGINCYQRSIQIQKNNKGLNHPNVLNLKNKLGNFYLLTAKMKQSQSLALEVLSIQSVFIHSECAKARLLLAKIFFQRGQYKKALQTLVNSLLTLEEAKIKEKNEKSHLYKSNVFRSQTYLQIMLLKTKIYNKIKNKELAQKSLNQIKTLNQNLTKNQLGQKTQFYSSIEVLESKAQLLMLTEGNNDIKTIEQMIKQLQQIGSQDSIRIACFYCDIVKYILNVGQFTIERKQVAGKYFEKASQIFKRYPINHPSLWVYFYIKAQLLQKNDNLQEAIKYATECIKMMNKKFYSSDITSIKAHLYFYKLLTKNNNFELAEKILSHLNNELKDDIQASSSKLSLENQRTVIKSVLHFIKSKMTQQQKTIIEKASQLSSGISGNSNLNIDIQMNS